MRNKYPRLKFDKLQAYFRVPYKIDLENAEGNIIVNVPTIGDIVTLGEDKFFTTQNIFVSNTTSCRLALWEAGKDWTEISDYEMFLMFFPLIENDAAKLIFTTEKSEGIEKAEKNVVKRLFNRLIHRSNKKKEQVTKTEQIDFSKFEYYVRKKPKLNKDGDPQVSNTGEPVIEEVPVLYSPVQNIEINEDVYEHIHQYLQFVFSMHPEDEMTKL